jgi:solute carrier family 25 protein 39/40
MLTPRVVDAQMPAIPPASVHPIETTLHLPERETSEAASYSAAASSMSGMALHATVPNHPAVKWSSSEMELSNQHRIISAGIGAFLTSLVVTPFDVVKTRLQAQINLVGNAASTAASSLSRHHHHPPAQQTASQLLLQDCSHYRLHTGLMDSWCNNCFTKSGVAPALSHRKFEELRFTGALDAAAKLIKHEGFSSLWRGLSPTILMSIPSTVVYFSMYDHVKITIAGVTPQMVDRYAPGYGQYTNQLQTLSPLLAGVTARAITTTLVSPIELVRTKSQSMRISSSMRELLMAEWKQGGFLSLWRGVGPTLMRDVPFSAIYWSTYEYSKFALLERWGASVARPDATAPPARQKSSWIYASFLAGAGSGMLSAAVTHPFDLIKTRRQIELYREEMKVETTDTKGHQHSSACQHNVHAQRPASTTFPHTTWQVFKTIIAEEGYVGLLSGLTARITKIAPACSIMIGTYEASKMMFGERQHADQTQAKHRYQAE